MAKHCTCSFFEYIHLLREDILGALRGVEIDPDADEKEQKEYPISDNKAKKIILGSFDEIAYQCMDAYRSGRVFESIAVKNTGMGFEKIRGRVPDYINAMMEERKKECENIERLGIEKSFPYLFDESYDYGFDEDMPGEA